MRSTFWAYSPFVGRNWETAMRSMGERYLRRAVADGGGPLGQRLTGFGALRIDSRSMDQFAGTLGVGPRVAAELPSSRSSSAPRPPRTPAARITPSHSSASGGRGSAEVT